MQLKNNGAGEVFIAYEATLGEENIDVYYDDNDGKIDLFEIETDGSAEEKTIHIMIELDDKCNDGSFSFVPEKSQK